MKISALTTFFLLATLECCTAYYAAVVQFKSKPEITNKTAQEVLEQKAQEYIDIIADITPQKPLDIVVFPEATLAGFDISEENTATYVPAAEEKVTPCDDQNGNYSRYFTMLSCVAKEKKTYVVINVDEKEECQKCGRKHNFYNTDVVFDRNGQVIARYRKFNLFGELSKNRTKTPEQVTFKTDFGEEFGVFTCFDIVFKSPTLDLVTSGVKNLAFPTMWFSEMPFLTAVQAQSMFAHETETILLAANANFGERGSGGSGIYAGGVPIIYGTAPLDVNFYYYANVSEASKSEVPSTPPVVNDTLAKELYAFSIMPEDLSNYTSHALSFEPALTNASYELCHKDDQGDELCCNFELDYEVDTTKTGAQYTYHLVVFKGVRYFTTVANVMGQENCGLIACLNSSKTSCGQRLENYDEIVWPVTFKTIKITANYTDSANKRHYPNSLLADLQVIPNEFAEWTSTKKGDHIERSYTLKTPYQKLYTFAIYGRDFSADIDPRSPSNTVRPSVTTYLGLLVLALISYFVTSK